MKKIISMALAFVMLFSVMSVAFVSSAEADIPVIEAYTVNFYSPNGTLLRHCVFPVNYQLYLQAGQFEPDSYDNPDDGLTYYFVGWEDHETGLIRSSDQLPDVTCDVDYYAVFEARDVNSGPTLMKFFASIFERMNRIFEYFWNIFFVDRTATA